MSITIENWRLLVNSTLSPLYRAQNSLLDVNLNDPVDKQNVDTIFNAVTNGNKEFLCQTLPGIDFVNGGVQSPDLVIQTHQYVNATSLFRELQQLIIKRSCEAGCPEIIKHPMLTTFQARTIQCNPDSATDCRAPKTRALPLNLGNFADMNDMKISSDGTLMVTAGRGISYSGAGSPPNANDIGIRRLECREFPVTTPLSGDETYGGINIYARSKCEPCCKNTPAHPEWTLIDSILRDVTITRVHINCNSDSIAAYDGTKNVLYVVKRDCRMDGGKWFIHSTIDFKLRGPENIGTTYGPCHTMGASADHSIILVFTKALRSTSDTTVLGYVVTNGKVRCDDETSNVYQKLNTNTKNPYTVVQQFTDPTLRYNTAIISRDGFTMAIEYGETGQIFPNPRVGIIGLYVYHLECVLGACQYVRRQTIVYKPIIPNTFQINPPIPGEYTTCFTGYTTNIRFAGANDDRIIRIALRGRMPNSFSSKPQYPHQPLLSPSPAPVDDEFKVPGNVRYWEETEILHVFDRPELSVNACGKKFNSCPDVLNQNGVTVRRVQHVDFAEKPYVELFGNNNPFMSVPGGLYTHPINKHVFLQIDILTNSLQLYSESTTDNTWILLPSSRWAPFEWTFTSTDDFSRGFSDYMSIVNDSTCANNKTVCVPFSRPLDADFRFSTTQFGLGRYDGPQLATDLAGTYYTVSNQNDLLFIQTPRGSDEPCLTGWPQTRLINPPAPNIFTGGLGPNPGSVPTWPFIPFPLYFNVWQQWPKDSRFPKCRTGYFKLTAQSPCLRIGCDTTVTLVLTPRYYDFDPNSTEPSPDPNTNPEFIFSTVTVPAFLNVSTVCFDLLCSDKGCRLELDQFPYYFHATPVDTTSCEPS